MISTKDVEGMYFERGRNWDAEKGEATELLPRPRGAESFPRRELTRTWIRKSWGEKVAK